MKDRHDFSQDPLSRELMVLKRDIELYEINQPRLAAETLWMVGIFLMLNSMVAGGLLFLAVALKELWEPEMKKQRMKKFEEKLK